MCIKSDANNGQQYQKRLFAVKRNKQNRNWFYFNLSFESSSFVFNNFKTEKFKLTFQGWNGPVCNLFGLTRVSFCQNCISPSNSEANRDGANTESPFPLFFSFSASFKNSSPRERFGNCLRFGTGGWSLCFYPLLSLNIWIFFPTLTMAARAKKISGKAICSRHQRESALSRFGARVRYWIWLRGSASYVIIHLNFFKTRPQLSNYFTVYSYRLLRTKHCRTFNIYSIVWLV